MSEFKSGCYKNESYIKNDYKCEFCGKVFNTYKHSFALHVNRCSCNPNSTYYKTDHVVKCMKCGCEYIVKCSDRDYSNGKYRKCCSTKCQHSRTHTSDTKQAISKSLISFYGIDHSPRYCKRCGKELTRLHLNRKRTGYCSECCHSEEFYKEFPISNETRDKLREAGKHSAASQSESRRSKNEIEFCNLCEQYFSHVEHNVPIFNGWDADVIIHDIKYAVLWNGIWHYKKLTESHSVERVQHRDRVKIDEIIKCGYVPYIIKDVGKHNKSFVKDEFDKFIKLISES